jgi:hypothetical protein
MSGRSRQSPVGGLYGVVRLFRTGPDNVRRSRTMSDRGFLFLDDSIDLVFGSNW